MVPKMFEPLRFDCMYMAAILIMWTRCVEQTFVPPVHGSSLLFANICPLFKKEEALACKYCPVSLTCVPCKLLEHIVCSNIIAHLDEYQLLSDRQHAFRKRHNCETLLTTVINKLGKNLGQRRTGWHSYSGLREVFWHHPTPLMNYLKANYLVMALAEGHPFG